VVTVAVFTVPPATAAWQHGDAPTGFEVAFFHPVDAGWQIEG
jgi:uncharacterized protein